jgi:hypothetical protein
MRVTTTRIGLRRQENKLIQYILTYGDSNSLAICSIDGSAVDCTNRWRELPKLIVYAFFCIYNYFLP